MKDLLQRESAVMELSSALLIGILSDEMVLYVKSRNAHWHVTGIDFYQMHLLFREQYEELDQIIDDVAERIRTLSFYPPATMTEYLELSHLKERIPHNYTSLDFIQFLLADHEYLIKFLRETLLESNPTALDPGTQDFLSGLLARHEKISWKLKSHLQ